MLHLLYEDPIKAEEACCENTHTNVRKILKTRDNFDSIYYCTNLIRQHGR